MVVSLKDAELLIHFCDLGLAKIAAGTRLGVENRFKQCSTSCCCVAEYKMREEEPASMKAMICFECIQFTTLHYLTLESLLGLGKKFGLMPLEHICLHAYKSSSHGVDIITPISPTLMRCTKEGARAWTAHSVSRGNVLRDAFKFVAH